MNLSTLHILERLISFPTVSRDSNMELMGFVQSFLAEHGIEAELFVTPDGRKANLFATLGPAGIPGVMLSGHTDVVPVDGQAWTTDPFRMTEAGGRAYGRGTADMKGFIACALSLIGRARDAKLRIPIHLAFSHDEEIGCIGVRSMIEALGARGFRPHFAIIGEPTEMRVATGHKGKINARATCCGVAGHSAMAPLALNALHLACDFVGAVRRSQDAIAKDGPQDPDYNIPYTTLHVGRMEGGTTVNIVPSQCLVDFEIRNIAEDDAGTILDRLLDEAARIAEAQRKAFPEAAIQVDILNSYPGLATRRDAEAVRFVSGLVADLVADARTFKVAFGTEGGLFSQTLNVPAVICGPGSMDQGHKPDEFIALDQLAACDRMMDRLLQEACR